MKTRSTLSRLFLNSLLWLFSTFIFMLSSRELFFSYTGVMKPDIIGKLIALSACIVSFLDFVFIFMELKHHFHFLGLVARGTVAREPLKLYFKWYADPSAQADNDTGILNRGVPLLFRRLIAVLMVVPFVVESSFWILPSDTIFFISGPVPGSILLTLSVLVLVFMVFQAKKYFSPAGGGASRLEHDDLLSSDDPREPGTENEGDFSAGGDASPSFFNLSARMIINFALALLLGMYITIVRELDHSTLDPGTTNYIFFLNLSIAILLLVTCLLIFHHRFRRSILEKNVRRWLSFHASFGFLVLYGLPYILTEFDYFFVNTPLVDTALHMFVLFILPFLAIAMIYQLLSGSFLSRSLLTLSSIIAGTGLIIGLLVGDFYLLPYRGYLPAGVIFFVEFAGILMIHYLNSQTHVKGLGSSEQGTQKSLSDYISEKKRAFQKAGAVFLLLAINVLFGCLIGVIHLTINTTTFPGECWYLIIIPVGIILPFIIFLNEKDPLHSRFFSFINHPAYILGTLGVFVILWYSPYLLASSLFEGTSFAMSLRLAIYVQLPGMFMLSFTSGSMMAATTRIRLKRFDYISVLLVSSLSLILGVAGWQISFRYYGDPIVPTIALSIVVLGLIGCRFGTRIGGGMERPRAKRRKPKPARARRAFGIRGTVQVRSITVIRNHSLSILLIAGIIVIGVVPPLINNSVFFSSDEFLYLDPDAPIEARVDDLLCRLTLKEKISILLDTSPAIDRLGIKPHYHGNEALHGIVRPGQFTVFPQAIALAATFDPESIYLMADMATNESRALYNSQGGIPVAPYCGMLTFFSPNVNMARDPRWGRTPETYGEDPWLTSRMAVAFVKGLQGTPFNETRNYSVPIKAVATPKHFVANNEEYWVTDDGMTRTRFNISADVSEKWLREYYFSGFRAAIKEAGAECIMSAYNALNGVPCCANSWLLTEVLRNEWGHEGYVVTDCGGVGVIRDGHHFVSTKPEACAAAIKSGVDLECGGEFRQYLFRAIDARLLSMADLDRAVRRVLRSRFRLGLFDPPERDPYAGLTTDVIGCEAHHAMAIQLAEESMVLLKNEPVNGTPVLPIKINGSISSLAIVGPGADRAEFGDYSGSPVRPAITPVAGIISRCAEQNASGQDVELHYVPWDDARNFEGETDDAARFHDEIAVASASDVAVVVVGLGWGSEHEGMDRLDLSLPEAQVRLINAVANANPRTVVIFTCGSSVTMDSWLSNVPAVLNMWYAGEAGGTALARILFGDVSPSGRLPITFYNSEDQLPPFWDYDIYDNRTYMYLKGQPLFPFGHGLSYAEFEYSNLSLNGTTFTNNSGILVELNVHNAAMMDADEVVQVYIQKINTSDPLRPVKQLKGFKRVHVPGGSSNRVKIPIKARDLAIWDYQSDDWLVETGAYRLLVGAASNDIRLNATFYIA
ncbi:MAG: glycoside hydrolase family 3 C-terminal domain-containing protein [Promethearchaeota archaeon]